MVGRQKGAKNLPKSVSYLLKLIKEGCEREGLDYETVIGKKDVANLSEEEKNELIEKVQSLNIELEPEEQDSFECGKCGAVLGSEVAHCPDCGAELGW